MSQFQYIWLTQAKIYFFPGNDLIAPLNSRFNNIEAKEDVGNLS